MARSYNGSSDTSFLPSDFNLQISGSITISAWINQDALVAGYKTILGKNSESADHANFILRQNLSGKLAFAYYGTTTGWQEWTTTDVVITTGQWIHVVLTYTFGTAASITIYVDNVSKTGSWTAGTGTDAPLTGLFPLRVGYYANGSGASPLQYWNGDISDIAIWDVVLSASEVDELYQQTNPTSIQLTDLKAYITLASNIVLSEMNRYAGFATIVGATLANGPNGDQIPIGLTSSSNITIASAVTFENPETTLVVRDSPSVIREHGNIVYDVSDATYPYKMYYTSQNGATEEIYMAHTTSLSGPWTTYASNPVIPVATLEAEDPYAVLDSGTYHMWTENKVTEVDIAHFTSTDGISWTLQNNKALTIGAVGQWDHGAVASPIVFKEGTTWYMFYEGATLSTFVDGKIGLATASDPNGPWTREATNPVLDKGSANLWDDAIVVSDDIKKIGSTYYMLYHASDGLDWRTGLAYSTDLITWTKATHPATGGESTTTELDCSMFYYDVPNKIMGFEHDNNEPIILYDLYGISSSTCLFNSALFNNQIFNTCTSTVSSAHGIWEGPMAPPEIVKPWKDKEEYKEQTLELLIVATPTMGQLFKKDLSGLPYLTTYRDKLYDVLFKPITGTFNEWKIKNGVFLKKPFLDAEIKIKYESPQITFRPIREQLFRKTLYGNKLFGINIIRVAKEIIGIENLSLSFDFDDRSLANAVTNKPPIGEPEEQEREQDFTQPSSFVGTVIYTPDLNSMEIELNGRVYNYCNVPQRIYEQFESASSKGEYYNREIKGIYTC